MRAGATSVAKLEGFEATLVDEALSLAGALREQSAAALVRATPDAQRQALGLRNRLLMLLIDRVKRVRRAASYVFRNDQEIARKFSSTYERRRRSARRKATKEAALTGAAGAPGNGVSPGA